RIRSGNPASPDIAKAQQEQPAAEGGKDGGIKRKGHDIPAMDGSREPVGSIGQGGNFFSVPNVFRGRHSISKIRNTRGGGESGSVDFSEA
ncbi:MAG: hypothetical protein ACOCVJ_04130, partial [Verrucomicrobiota bacterium]